MTDNLIGRADKDTFVLFVEEEYLVTENLDENDNNLIQIQMFIVTLSQVAARKLLTNIQEEEVIQHAEKLCAEGGISLEYDDCLHVWR